MTKKTYRIIASIIAVTLITIIGEVYFPVFFGAILNVIWFLLFSVVVIFIGLGILVVFGLRKEVNKLLDMFLEGTLTIVDFFNFLKELFEYFVNQLKEFLLFLAPLLSYTVGFFIYLAIIYVYKLVGTRYDITYFTIGLTVFLLVVIGLINLPRDHEPVVDTWLKDMLNRVKSNMTDAYEVVLFVFFLTMERTDLFFLPPELNVPLEANIGKYDLMLRGFSPEFYRITLTIVIISVFTEIVRFAMRIAAVAVHEYRQTLVNTLHTKKIELLKKSIRESFNQSKDDTIKFIAFTTVLLFVFVFFPRLKLLAMATASLTGFVLDIAFTRRLFVIRGNDLISRIINKTLGL